MADMGENELEISGDMAELRRFRDRADARLAPPSERDPYNDTTLPLLSFIGCCRFLPLLPRGTKAHQVAAMNGRKRIGASSGARRRCISAKTPTASFIRSRRPGLPRLRSCSQYPPIIPR